MYSYLFKYIIIGDSNVGKSSIVLRLTDNRFQSNHDFTIGVEFGSKNINIDNQTIKLHIWDTAGQEAFRSITRSYYRNVAGVLLVYDITNRESFNQISHWLEEIKYHNQKYPPTIMLIANKSDLQHLRKVSTEEGQEFAKQHNLLFVETSTKPDNRQIMSMFETLTTSIYTKITDGTINIESETCGIRLGIKSNSELQTGLITPIKPTTKSNFCCFQ